MENESKEVTPSFVSTEMALECCGDFRLECVKELMLRGMGLQGFEESCAASLVSLEMLSMSHNCLSALNFFDHFINLTELNVSFNQLESLDGLKCVNLKRLFVTNNMVSNIESLRIFTNLHTLSLYGNRLNDLNECFATLRQLSKLRILDLGGNPCSRSNSYKHHTVRTLSRLEELDGDQITLLQKDLADQYFSECENTSAQVRPSTAPNMKPQGCLAGVYQGMNDEEQSAKTKMLRGNVRLFQSDFLNNNPILLEYLARSVMNDPAGSLQGDLVQMREQCNHETDDPPKNSRFVTKLRSSANECFDTEKKHYETTTIKPATHQESTTPLRHPRKSISQANADPSDPHATIRKLLKLNELLQNEKDMLLQENDGDSTSYQELLEENQNLKVENRNLYILQQENQSLKLQLQERTIGSDNEELMKENEKLKQEIAQLRRILESVQNPSDLVLEEYEDLDPEITSLIARNAANLEQIRNDIKLTKRQMIFQRAAAKTGEFRPQTSAGHGDADLHKDPSYSSIVKEDFKNSNKMFNLSVQPKSIVERLAHVRPQTASATYCGEKNLLGRPINTEADIQAAHLALKIAQEDLNVLRQAREIMVSRGRLETTHEASDDDNSHDEEPEDSSMEYSNLNEANGKSKVVEILPLEYSDDEYSR